MNRDLINYELEDFLANESFIDWVRDNKNDSFWTQYLQKYPHKHDLVQQAKHIIKNIKISEIQYSNIQIERIKQQIDWSIFNSEKNQLQRNIEVPKNTIWIKLFRIAATLLILFVFSFLVLDYLNIHLTKPDFEIATIKKETQNGQKLTIYLSDGSKVKLNYDSKISFPEKFSDSVRMVSLSGEAFFEVTEDTQRPFIVMSKQIKTQVLGTSFNIHSYPENRDFEVTVVTGKVSVAESKHQQKEGMVILPGQVVRYDSTGFKLIQVDMNEKIAWEKGIIHFKSASQIEVFERLSKWYGVQFEFLNTQSDSWNYTGKFDNLSLEQVLHSLSFVKNFDFEIINEKVLIKHKSMN